MSARPEFSHTVMLDSILSHKPRKETLTADAEACAGLAQRFGLKSLSNLKGAAELSRTADNKLIKVEGKVEADVVQPCVVSLQDVASHVVAHFETYFTEDGEELDNDPDFEFDLGDEDEPKLVEAGALDIGELAAQYLALEIDLYPRAPGVSLPAQMAGLTGKGQVSPFEALKNLKDKKKKE